MHIYSLSKESLNIDLHKTFPAHSSRVAPLSSELLWHLSVYSLELHHIDFMIIEFIICIYGL